MRDAPFVADLVTRARKGDQQAWDVLVERYSPLIWSICRRYRLDRADAEDVGQRTWLQFVNHLGAIRDPAALPGWLATTTRRECSRVVRAARGPQAAGQLLDENIPDKQAQDGRAGVAGGGVPRGAARGIHLPVSVPPAADGHADRGPSRAIYRDQRQAGHPGQQHRSHPPPLPGSDSPSPGHRGADQRRRRDRGVTRTARATRPTPAPQYRQRLRTRQGLPADGHHGDVTSSWLRWPRAARAAGSPYRTPASRAAGGRGSRRPGPRRCARPRCPGRARPGRRRSAASSPGWPR